MLILDNTKSITAKLQASPSANQPTYVAAYADSSSTSFTEGSSEGSLNGTNEVTLVSAPTSDQRAVKQIIIANKDTATVNVTVQIAVGANRYDVVTTHPILAGSSLVISDSIYVSPEMGPQGFSGAQGVDGAQGPQGVSGAENLGGFLYSDNITVPSYMFTTTWQRQFNNNKVRDLIGRVFASDGSTNDGKLYYDCVCGAPFGNKHVYIAWVNNAGAWMLFDQDMNPDDPDYEYLAYNDNNTTYPPTTTWTNNTTILDGAGGLIGKPLETGDTPISAEVLPMPTASVTIAAGDWSSSTATKTVYGVAATSVLWVSPEPTSYNDYVAAGIRATGQALDSITFTCDTTPTTSITVSVVIGQST